MDQASNNVQQKDLVKRNPIVQLSWQLVWPFEEIREAVSLINFCAVFFFNPSGPCSDFKEQNQSRAQQQCVEHISQTKRASYHSSRMLLAS